MKIVDKYYLLFSWVYSVLLYLPVSGQCCLSSTRCVCHLLSSAVIQVSQLGHSFCWLFVILAAETYPNQIWVPWAMHLPVSGQCCLSSTRCVYHLLSSAVIQVSQFSQVCYQLLTLSSQWHSPIQTKSEYPLPWGLYLPVSGQCCLSSTRCVCHLLSSAVIQVSQLGQVCYWLLTVCHLMCLLFLFMTW